MPTITLQDGQVVHISQESYDALKEAVKPKELTYENIAEKLFYKRKTFRVSGFGDDVAIFPDCYYLHSHNAPTENQVKQLLALNKLFNVAYYLNEGWVPDWKNDKEYKYFMYCDGGNERISTSHNVYTYYVGGVYFKSETLAKRAIAILGEKAIKECFGIFE